jgi:hypothetical protein
MEEEEESGGQIINPHQRVCQLIAMPDRSSLHSKRVDRNNIFSLRWHICQKTINLKRSRKKEMKKEM